jgi:starch phosphorylase
LAYTNHTLLPEALERWPVRLFEHLLPRVLEIIYEINARFLTEVASRWPGDMERERRMSLIEEGYEKQVRMAYLAIVGSFSVNGVAALHSRAAAGGPVPRLPRALAGEVQQQDQRRHPAALARHVQPGLRKLLDETIGDGWVNDLPQLRGSPPSPTTPPSASAWDASSAATRSARRAGERAAASSSRPDFMFDVQVKRIHEYKRQLLNVLHVIHLYDRIKRGDTGRAGAALRAHRRQGGARLRHGQAHHQADQQRRQGGQQRPAGAPWLRMAFMPDYNVGDGGASAPAPTSPSRSPPPARRLPAPAT